MSRTLTCGNGHQWLASDQPLVDGSSRCPHCGDTVRIGSLSWLPPPPPAAVPLPPGQRAGNPVAAAEPRSQAATVVPGVESKRPVAQRVGVPGYDLLGILGQGGMGVVYKARQVQLNRTVALKMMRAGVETSAEGRRRFRAEAEAVARLQHPNIVQVHDVGEFNGQLYFSMEFVAGSSLAYQLTGPLPVPRAAALLETLARAVHAAHQAGVIHRDLKPGNVLLTAEGTPKIADFGLAKRVNAAETLTQAGTVMGTPQYMSPEQAEGKAIGPTADVYALGAILYECLTGRPPFNGDSPLEVLRDVVTREPVAPALLRAGLPRDLETICLKCLEKDPRRRYGTALELAEDLGRFLAGQPTIARPVGALGRIIKWVKRRPLVAGLTGAVVASLLLATITAVALALQTADRERAEAEAEKKERELKEQVLRTEARNLMQPLGAQVKPDQPLPPLSDREIETLRQLGTTREEKLRLYFVEETLHSPALTQQLRYRAGFALQAAVGLDTSRRKAVERLLAERLTDGGLSQQQAVDLALCLAVVGDTESQTRRQAASILVQAVGRTPNPFELKALVQGLSALGGRLQPIQAKEVADTLLKGINEAPDDGAHHGLAHGLLVVAAWMEPAEAKGAKETADGILHSLNVLADHIRQLVLNEERAALAALAEPRQKKTAVALLLDDLEEMDPSSVVQLLQARTGFIARLKPKEAVDICGEVAPVLVKAMPKLTVNQERVTMAEVVSALAAFMEPREAAALAKQAAATLTQAISTTMNPAELVELAAGLSEVAAWMEPKEAAGSLLDTMSKTPDSVALSVLAQGLSPVFLREPSARRLRRAHALAASAGLITSPTIVAIVRTAHSPALEPAPDPLPAQALVDLLKDPLCVGQARRALLDALGNRYQRRFIDQWDFAHFATEQKLGLDLTSPPDRPRNPR